MQGATATAFTDKTDVPVGNECELWVTQAQTVKSPPTVQEVQGPGSTPGLVPWRRA